MPKNAPKLAHGIPKTHGGGVPMISGSSAPPPPPLPAPRPPSVERNVTQVTPALHGAPPAVHTVNTGQTSYTCTNPCVTDGPCFIAITVIRRATVCVRLF